MRNCLLSVAIGLLIANLFALNECKDLIDALAVEINAEPVVEVVKLTNVVEVPVYETETMLLTTVTATAYCPCAQCCGEWSDGITASGTTALEGRTIAVDPSAIPLGSDILINGSWCVAEDTGGAIKGDRIDIYFDSHDEALAFGVQEITIGIILKEEN